MREQGCRRESESSQRETIRTKDVGGVIGGVILLFVMGVSIIRMGIDDTACVSKDRVKATLNPGEIACKALYSKLS